MDDGGVNATHCGKDGEWTRDESEILKCLGKQSVCLVFFFFDSYIGFNGNGNHQNPANVIEKINIKTAKIFLFDS